jgi:hypothetical protein
LAFALAVLQAGVWASDGGGRVAADLVTREDPAWVFLLARGAGVGVEYLALVLVVAGHHPSELVADSLSEDSSITSMLGADLAVRRGEELFQDCSALLCADHVDLLCRP